MKSKGGAARLFKALRYSWQGIRAAIRHEAAFRQELMLSLPLLACTPWVAQSSLHALGLVGVWIAVWVVELLNSAVEAAIDRIGPEWHALSGRAKDLGSAAVLIALLLCAGIWGAALYQRIAHG